MTCLLIRSVLKWSVSYEGGPKRSGADVLRVAVESLHPSRQLRWSAEVETYKMKPNEVRLG